MAAEEFTEQVRAVLTGESPWLAKQRRSVQTNPVPSTLQVVRSSRSPGWVASSSGTRGTGNPPAIQLSARDA